MSSSYLRREPIFVAPSSEEPFLNSPEVSPRVSNKHAFPLGLRRFLLHRFYEGIGLFLFVFAVAITVSLATWRANDPSLSNAIAGVPYNYLGVFGAIFADQAIGFFGLSACLFSLIPFGWSLNFFSHSVPQKILRKLLFSCAALVSLSVFLSLFKGPPGWVLGCGLGGSLGDVVGRWALLGGAFFIPREIALFLAGSSTFLFSLFFITKALGGRFPAFLKRRRPQDEEAREEEEPEIHPKVKERIKKHLFAGGVFCRALLFRLLKKILTLLGFSVAPTPAKRRMEPLLVRVAGGDAFFSGAQEDDDDLQRSEETAPHREGVPSLKRQSPVPSQKGRGGAPLKNKIFDFPPLELLKDPPPQKISHDLSEETLEQNARMLESVLEDFGVRGEIIHVRPGPVVTLYELEPAPGIKSSRVIGLADDIARSMCALSVRVAVVPGRNAIGIELPNQVRQTVYLRELLASSSYTASAQALCLALGKNIGGEPIYADLARMPHVLIAGTTGSGKSVGINAMILSLLYRLSPQKCRLIMIDPKMLELSVYEGIPHLLSPVVTDPKKAVVALKWAVREMEDRYRKMSKLGVRNIDGFNARVQEASRKGEPIARTVQTGYDLETGEPIFEREEMNLSEIPYIVIVIDEMADLMMVAGKDIEGAVQRLAQMARAAGIHVIMATQRPSVDVITGTIKANFPTRVSFQVTSKIDSRTILGEQGAEQLLGQGDMLYMVGGGRISRLHAPFVSDDEVEKIVYHLKMQGAPEYVEAVTEDLEESYGSEGGGQEHGNSGDALYDQACAVILRDRKASTSYIQRRLQIGYNKAASLIERMEQEGLISAPNATGKREILVPSQEE